MTRFHSTKAGARLVVAQFHALVYPEFGCAMSEICIRASLQRCRLGRIAGEWLQPRDFSAAKAEIVTAHLRRD
jgi:hypothetical protein